MVLANPNMNANQNGQAAFLERIHLAGQGTPNPEAVITAGNARFTILTERLVRLEWSGTDEFEERGTFAFPNRYIPVVPRFNSQSKEETLTIDTEYLQIRYRLNSGKFTSENLQISFQVDGQSHLWTPGTPNPLNLGGTNRTLDMTGGDVRISEGLVSRAGWALFDDSHAVLLNPQDNWVEPRRNTDYQDWYFFGYGHDYKAALTEYIQFGGAIPLIPRFVLGAWWSRYWAYSDQDLKDLVLDFEAHNLPLDVLVVDIDWHTPDSWTGYTWNKELFPDPTAFLSWVHAHGLRTTLNLHPALGVQSFEEAYPAFARAMGVDPATQQPIPFHITDKKFAQNYFEILHHPHEEEGVDFWWMDWQQGESSEMVGLDPLIWLNHLHFYDSTRRGERAMLYSRWGGLGNHRYHIGFSGDTLATWGALQFQPYMTATAANVLYGWWSHDIGGHIGPTEPELYARWVQYGALSPCLRLHSTKDALAERRPWAFAPDVYEAAKAAFQLRYQLVPYLYTWARVNSDTGIALCRPMYYDYPQNEAAYNARYQYMLGDDMLVAPIVFPADPLNGVAAIDVWIPTGTWIDYHTLETFNGPRWVRLVGDINRIPMLVKAGAIVPLASVAPTTDALPKDRLTLRVFVYSDTQATFRLYEDDNITSGYEQGQFEWTNIKSNTISNQVQITIEAVEGHCEGLPTYRAWTIALEGTVTPTDVKTEGATELSFRHEPATNTTFIDFRQPHKSQPINLIVNFADSPSVLGEAHNHEVIAKDLRQLLGFNYDKFSYEQLLKIVPELDVNILGRTDAQARVGGPLVRVLEYVSPNDTVCQLGTVIVGEPTLAGDQYKGLEVKVNWTLFRNGLAEKFVSQATPADLQDGGYILHSPFAAGPGDPAHQMQWTAQIDVEWGDASLTFAYRSKTLFPSITDWSVVVYDLNERDYDLTKILNSDNQLNPQLEWQTFKEEIDTAISLDGSYTVPLYKQYLERLQAGEKLGAYIATTITSPDERDVMLEYRAAGGLTFWVNGEPVAEPIPTTGGLPLKSNVYNRFQLARATAMVHLKAGVNTLVAQSLPPSRHHWWQFSVAVVRPDGSLMNDLTYSNSVQADNQEVALNPDPRWTPPTQAGLSQTDTQVPTEKKEQK